MLMTDREQIELLARDFAAQQGLNPDAWVAPSQVLQLYMRGRDAVLRPGQVRAWMNYVPSAISQIERPQRPIGSIAPLVTEAAP